MFGLGMAGLVIVLGALWVGGRSGLLRSPKPVQPASIVPSANPMIENERSVYAQYSGSESCQDCHPDQYELWKNSNHGLAERPVDSGQDRRAFDPARSFRHGTQTTTVNWSNNVPEVASIGLSGRPETHSIARVIGNDPLRQFLVPLPGGRFQTLEASYDPKSNEWFNVYGNEDRGPGEWGHWTGRGMNWNSMCAGCHNTRVRKNYDEATDAYQTTMAEPTVSCEACHGPLEAHNNWQKQFSKSGRKDPTLTRVPPAKVVDYCGFCHARRGDLTGDFKPGDAFLDHFRLTIVDNSETYYPDGQVRDEDYEYAAFLGSGMHFRGVHCVDCHNPHSAKTILPGNWLCMRCHNGTYTNAPVIDPVSHSHHQVFGYSTNGVLVNTDLTAYQSRKILETGGECVNCHMPQTTYMQRHRRHDHGFTIPDPLLTKQAGIPNACNRCHLDKDTDWSLKYCDQWYGRKMDRPSRHRAQAIAAARKGESASVTVLLDLLATNEIPYWRAVSAGLLESWEFQAPVRDALLRGLRDSNALVRAECVHGLEQAAATGGTEVTAALREKLEDPVRAVRVAAAWALRSTLELSSKPGAELVHFLAINADQPAGQMERGALALARGDGLEASRHYAKAIKWDPNSAAIRHDYAVVLSGLNQKQEALEQLQAACRLEPVNAEFQYKLALAWNELGKTEETIAALQTAVRLDPGHARAWYNLGLALNSTGRTEEAVQSLIRAESVDSSDPRSPYARATILARLNRWEEARRAAQRALEIDSQFEAARELLRQMP
jgi:tetratricopeptide (TPR) repeat protein